jgi:type I restriction enzyme S subunit
MSGSKLTNSTYSHLRGHIVERCLRLKNGDRLPVVSVTNQHGIQLASETFSKQLYSRDLTNYKIIKSGWYAFNPSRINVGSLARNDIGQDACVSPMYTVFEFVSSDIDHDYFKHFIETSRFTDTVGTNLQGSVRDALSFDALESFRIHRPSLAFQRSTAEILTTIQCTIEQIEVLVEAHKRFKRDLFVHLQQSQISAGTCEVFSLREITSSLEAGVSVNAMKREKKANEIGVLKISAVSSGIFIPEENKSVLASELPRISTPVRGDCIIITRKNTPELVGSSAYIEKDYDDLYLPDTLWLLDIIDRERINVKWLSNYIGSAQIRKRLSELASGTSASMQGLSKKTLLKIPVAAPPIEAQNKSSELIFLIDKRIDLELQYLKKLKNVKSNIAQELFSGRLSLPESMIARHGDKPGQAA